MTFEEKSAGVSRRELLRGMAAGAAGLAMLGGSDAAGAAKSPYGPFRMGIQSYSLRAFSTEEALKLTKSLGLKYWEAYPAHFNITESPTEIAKYKALLKAYEVKLAAYGVVGFGNNEAEARHTFAFAKAMGIETLSASPSEDSFGMLDKLVAEFKINIAIHNHGPGDRYAKVATVNSAVQGHNERIGACIDTGHYLRSNEDPVAAVTTFGRRTHDVHLKDVLDTPNGEKRFTEVGKGNLKTLELLQALKKINYKGMIALEYEEHERDPVSFIEECLAATREAVKQMTGAK